MEGGLDCPETFWGGICHFKWILIATLLKKKSPHCDLHFLISYSQTCFRPPSALPSPLTLNSLGFSQLTSGLTTMPFGTNDLHFKLKNRLYIGVQKGKTCLHCRLGWPRGLWSGVKRACMTLGNQCPEKGPEVPPSGNGDGLDESWLKVHYLLWDSWRSWGYVT